MAAGPRCCVGAALQCTGVGDIALHPRGSRCERGPSHLEQPWQEQQLLEVPSPVPQCRGCLAAGRCWDGSPGGEPSGPRCPQGMQQSLCGAFRKGLSDKDTGQCHTPGFRVVQSLFPRGGRAASKHREGPGSSTAPLSAPPSCPAAAPAACASSSSSQPRPAPGAATAPGSPGPLRAKAHPACPGCPARRVEEFVTRLQLQSRPGPGRVSLHVVEGVFLAHSPEAEGRGKQAATGAASSAPTAGVRGAGSRVQPLLPPLPLQLPEQSGGVSQYTGLQTQPGLHRQLLFAQGWNCGTSQCFYVNK